MADEFDRASELEELARISALNYHQKNLAPSVQATGYCLYCGEELDDGRRWCDASCRDDWEAEQCR